MDLKGHMFKFFFILMLVKLAWKYDSYFLKLSVEWSMGNHTNDSKKSPYTGSDYSSLEFQLPIEWINKTQSMLSIHYSIQTQLQHPKAENDLGMICSIINATFQTENSLITQPTHTKLFTKLLNLRLKKVLEWLWWIDRLPSPHKNTLQRVIIETHLPEQALHS